MSSHQYHSHHPSKLFSGVYCPHCDPCPTCGAVPASPAPRANDTSRAPQSSMPASTLETPAHRADDPGRERVLPTMPIAFLFTLFILEAHIQGGWLHLLIPYTICLLVFYL
ncbi:hypothetical protein DFH06DRAFT_1348530 [Mycena polygramma]|nr:hypothetical protein DFH06DRAFT_1348530 [Mycena polygramma]